MKMITPISDSIFKKLNEEELLLINELYLDMVKYKNVIDNIKDKTNKMIESNNSALSNPEYTIVSKHQLLKLSNEELKDILELLEEVE